MLSFAPPGKWDCSFLHFDRKATIPKLECFFLRPDTFYAAPKRASPLLYSWPVQTPEPASLHGLEPADSLDESKMRWLRFFTLILRIPRPQPSHEFHRLQFSRQSFAP
ncbi:hypothetical protein FRC14_001766 [Serendipita sp. 396]|nr:hypothetical protein FRC14_001766 [Serendipita sp. 396]